MFLVSLMNEDVYIVPCWWHRTTHLHFTPSFSPGENFFLPLHRWQQVCVL